MAAENTLVDRFRFGRNWQDFIKHSLNDGAYGAAKSHLHALITRHGAPRASFLDIGCGSGLFLSAALQEGFGRVVGFDYDPDSIEASRQLVVCSSRNREKVRIMRGDVLDSAFLTSLGKFSFVYAWGSLHHTGSMWQAIKNAAEQVSEQGVLVISIYNRSLTSPVWKLLKRLYVRSGRLVRNILIGTVYVAGAIAKAIYTCKNPFREDRGMNFYYDIIDWVGGYPYEYASIKEVTKFVEKLGFELIEVTPGATPIACNEFVFRNIARKIC